MDLQIIVARDCHTLRIADLGHEIYFLVGRYAYLAIFYQRIPEFLGYVKLALIYL